MSELVDLTPSGGGGMDDGDPAGGADFEAAEALLEDGALDEAPDAPDPYFSGEGDDPDGGGEGEWFDALPDDLRDAASKYGSLEAMVRGMSESQSAIGRMGSEIGQLRDQLADLSSRGPEPQRQDGGGGMEPSRLTDVVAWAEDKIIPAIDEGQIDVGKGLSAIVTAMAGVSEEREAHLIKRMEALMADRTAPLEQANHRTEVGREIRTIRDELGTETYNELAPAVQDLLREWERSQPGFIQNPRAIRAAFGEAHLRTQARRRRESSAQVLERGGRGATRRGPTPEQVVIDEMRALNPSGLGGGL